MSPDDPRMDKVEEARWRVANGYYDLPDVLEESVERILRSLPVLEGVAEPPDEPDEPSHAE